MCSTIPKGKGLLVLANGAYGARIAKEAAAHSVKCHLMEWAEDTMPDPVTVSKFLNASENKDYHTVVMVHSETTSGIINDIQTIGRLVKESGRRFMVDAMSSFGGMPIDFKACHIDYLVTSANKCIEGVPGFAIVIANKEALKVS